MGYTCSALRSPPLYTPQPASGAPFPDSGSFGASGAVTFAIPPPHSGSFGLRGLPSFPPRPLLMKKSSQGRQELRAGPRPRGLGPFHRSAVGG